jgi:hypothetical protein
MNTQRFLSATAIVGALAMMPTAAMAKANAAPAGQSSATTDNAQCADGSTPNQDGACPPARPANGSAAPATDE